MGKKTPSVSDTAVRAFRKAGQSQTEGWTAAIKESGDQHRRAQHENAQAMDADDLCEALVEQLEGLVLQFTQGGIFRGKFTPAEVRKAMDAALLRLVERVQLAARLEETKLKNVGDQHLHLIKEMEARLAGLQKDRDSRSEWVEWRGGQELAWHVYEMEGLLKKVNEVRTGAALDMDALVRVERMARGHSDYSHKLAIYAAELAEGKEDIQP